MGKLLKVLYVEDSAADAELVGLELRRGGFAPDGLRVETRDQMVSALRRSAWDLILCDYSLPQFSAEEALNTLHNSGLDLPFIITSGAVEAEDVVNLLKQGAHDFMSKESYARLIPAIERELRDAEVRRLRRQAEDKVRILSRAVEQSPVAVVISDAQGVIEYVNPRFEQATGYTAEEAIGQELGFTLLDEDSAQAMRELLASVQNGREWRGEFCHKHRDGQLFWEFVHASPLNNDQGQPTHFVIVKEDITVRRSYEEQLLRQAHYDHLTGLANRALMVDRLTVAVASAQRHQHLAALLFIDLDHFKNVNDSLGHSIGDALLTKAAGRLSACIRGGDTLARMGGDEFVIVLPEVGSALEVQQIAEKIIDAFARSFTLIGREYFVTASVGIALYPQDGENPHLILRNADLAMYKAKDLGRNQFHFFTEDINTQLMQRLELETRLRHAVKRRELELHYQPIFNLQTQKIVGIEALVRWRQPDGSLWAPNRFIPQAEDMSIVAEIDNWVLSQACTEAAPLLKAGGDASPMRLALNVSATQLQVPGFDRQVTEQLAMSGLVPAQLELEVTERVLVDDDEQTQRNMNALCELGVRLSIDDFGTGYSSLGYLQKYPFKTLKIDRSFVSQIIENPHTGKLVETIVVMARGLDLEVVAEGVETEEQRQRVAELGCDQAQGYLLGYPVPIAELYHRITPKAQ
ncbi:putative bifunctional diguanylate cyclase/phosphodiesterase [Marinimicrobium alkaliphilum]|uniref:putative bifunctional diguanylate cyclase/phosphodiesterase n=1 Tax=Marinimicrobium alkaliphilum TaxID=2202654 RepID=UPI000DBA9A65|nr:GGDEF domain-containing response regulator [Marinimicrobium alkaliphilum]